jgi:hypothetical protein
LQVQLVLGFLVSEQLWSKKDRRAVLMLTHGYPSAVFIIGEIVAGLILASGDSKSAGAVSMAAMALTGVLARLGRLAAPAAIAGVGIVSPPPSDHPSSKGSASLDPGEGIRRVGERSSATL